MPTRPRPTIAALLAGVLALPPAAAAQGAAPAAPNVVRGVVFDSLANRPLAGAQVFVEGLPTMATADAAGRFTVAGIPAGRQLLAAEHPALAGVGLSALRAAVDVADGAPADVMLSTPGRAAVWRRVCGAPPPERDAAVLYGDVRDAGTDARLPGATVRVTWAAPATADGLRRANPVRREVRTDSAGVYRVCGLPHDAPVDVVASAGPHATGRVVVAADDRGLVRMDLLVPRDATPLARVAGVVRDTAGVARAGVHVEVDAADGPPVVTDAEGRFALQRVAAGTRTLRLRAPGQAPVAVPVGIRPASMAPLELTLRIPVPVARVLVGAGGPSR